MSEEFSIEDLIRKMFPKRPQGGRPTKEESEFKDALKEFQKFKKLKDSGFFEEIFNNIYSNYNSQNFASTPGPNFNQEEKNFNPQSIFEKFFSGDYNDLLDLGLTFFGDYIEDAIKLTIKFGAPIALLLFGLYFIEDLIRAPKIENNRIVRDSDGKIVYQPMPQPMHNLVKLFLAVLTLFETLTTFLVNLINVNPSNLIKGAINTIAQNPAVANDPKFKAFQLATNPNFAKYEGDILLKVVKLMASLNFPNLGM